MISPKEIVMRYDRKIQEQVIVELAHDYNNKNPFAQEKENLVRFFY